MTTARTRHNYAGRSVQERRAERRALFIEAGLTVFAEKSYAASSISDVCAAAGLSRRQFYEQYSSREALLIDIYDQVQHRARAALVEGLATAAGSDPREMLAAATRAYVHAVTDDIRCAQIAFVEIVGVSDTVERHRLEIRDEWVRLIEDTATAVPGSRTPPGGWGLAMAAFIGAVNASAHRWSRSEPRPPVDDLLDVLSTLLRALVLPDTIDG
ncbi:TetR/AcrR family transcriptional regulator [Nocardia cyriacigeorgica]|uniref:Putative transcriptional regulator, TetR family protein n=1 Tax=Nocardia cyriacigeorgica (strain GUH-2) TaxID=1127134 RepID=H6R3B3_NOCCG|nr:TetR/AcrR family transcriptional regulator [Nocardia cyriacigeorgica]MBF6285234.1 TetR/AcrR family transcriptional regulator [Nocardia cyriacigeorgica]BDT89409.1 TetR family transcriptional regulator [Nocardia cyriacigeorgica]CCF65711.1 putative transcriptional regulator, TetR family protein [Nocardia cyriacigeorgica GUH-2]